MRIASLLLALILLPSAAFADVFAVDPAPAPPPPPVEQTAKPSMTPALIATGVSVAIAAATVATYWKFHSSAENQHARNVFFTDPEWADRWVEDQNNVTAWRDRTIAMVALTAISGGVTGYMWSRRERAPTVNVTPMSGGVRVSLARAF